MQSRVTVSANAKGWLHDSTPSATHPVGFNVVIESVTAPPFSSCLALHRTFLVRREAANMAFADFCTLTPEITPRRAMRSRAFAAAFARVRLAAHRRAWTLVNQFGPSGSLRYEFTSHLHADLPE